MTGYGYKSYKIQNLIDRYKTSSMESTPNLEL